MVRRLRAASQPLPRLDLRKPSRPGKWLDAGYGQTLHGQHHMPVAMNEKHPLDWMSAEIRRVDVPHRRLVSGAFSRHAAPAKTIRPTR